MTDYVTLTGRHLDQVVAERVHALELDHARMCLVLAEEVNERARHDLGEQLAEIVRRIAVHVPTADASDASGRPIGGGRPSYPDGSDGSIPLDPDLSTGNVVKGETSNETVTTAAASGE